MITVIVWSKDRACQTELCLRSLKEKFHVDKKIYCQYTSTSEAYEMGFQKVASMHPDVEFVKEVNFKETLSGLLEKVDTEYLLFHTDDDVYLQDVDDYEIEECERIDKSYDLSAYSLRMNPFINRCYPANNKEIKPPRIDGDAITFIWNWKEAEDQHCCWGYPMAIDSHIYRSKDIIPLIQGGRYHNVNSLESYCNGHRWHDKPYMLSFTETKVYNVQNNFVQGPRQNEQEYSVEWLNEQFLAGKRISTEPIYGMQPRAAHGTAIYEMESI
jgi:hypothetical protein